MAHIDQVERPPPETLGRLQESLTNYPNRPTAQRGDGSLQRPGQATAFASNSQISLGKMLVRCSFGGRI
jgi:hypothetical protein